MHVGELPMIIFTVVAQMSVGAFWTLGLIQFLGRLRRVDRTAVDRITNAGLYAAGPLLVLGFFAAFFHLHDPFHSPFTLLHLGSSWLSRELVSGVAYGAFGAVFALTQWFNWLSRTAREVLAALTAVAGLFLIISMSGVYYFTVTVPAWHSWFTWVLFFGSTLFTGPLAVAVALTATLGVSHKRRTQTRVSKPSSGAGQPMMGTRVSRWRKSVGFVSRGFFPEGSFEPDAYALSTASLRMSNVISVVSGLCLLVAYGVRVPQLALGTSVEHAVAQAMTAHGYLVIRLVTLVIAVVLTAWVARKSWDTSRRPARALVWGLGAAFVFALVTELIGRGMHYEGLIHVGLNTTFG
ncbi:dimethyl sulfoxide reductase anchor subunit [Gleimia hominis]|uniref:Dimethyl sulfoxide reductase anchor subunit n=1 Tax=Gleimia hominis TaxID=595468 RepID=A0ABU3I8D5_9ACTO|nr:DmsC/YnfH family molybdoenzyme membrane anchor subunit [Gleimia hominis]MDT3766643.1 dimethyl sulfoxide reductase anchor subunit [Gleimia hominis]